jgi:hypothetical protein
MLALIQAIDMLFSRKRKHGAAIIYAGFDLNSREDEFLAKCVDGLCYLQERDSERYDLFIEHVGRILGTNSFSKSYYFPKVIEASYSDILNDSVMSVASLIVGYTKFAQCRNQIKETQYSMDEIHRICIDEEAQFQKRVTGVPLSELELLKLNQKRFMPIEIKRSILKKMRSQAVDKMKGN